jgi:glycosyltransferase involved in cell wall biosynthesis
MNSLNGHILVVTSVYPHSLMDRHAPFIREGIIRLKTVGAQFTVFAPSYEGCHTHILDNVKVHRFRYFPKKFENLTRDGAPTKIQKQPLYLVAAAFYIFLGTLQLFWVCLLERPDVLHIHWPFPHGLMALPANKLLGIPMVFTFHGTELMLAKKFGFVKPIFRWLLPISSSVTANSIFTQSLIRKFYEGPIEVIPYGLTVNVKPYKNISHREVPILFFAGRLIERKGLRYLLEAVAFIQETQPVRLRVAGDGDSKVEFESICKNLNIESSVDFLGLLDQEDLEEEYNSCSIFVLPSITDSKGETEGLGIVLIEALAHGKPVVSTSVGGIVDIVIPGETGLLVPEKDSKALAEALLTLLSDPVRAKKMGQRGFEDVQSRFNWTHIIPMWQKTFEKVLG